MNRLARKERGAASPATSLPWKYCECGCKMHTVTFGSQTLAIYNDLEKTGASFHLFSAHWPRGSRIGSYASFEAADLAARHELKGEFQQLKDSIEQFSHLF